MKRDNALDRSVAALIRDVAGDIILPRFQTLSSFQIEEKLPGDLVTVADRESEMKLAEGLSEILPEASIVGEEAVAADPRLLDQLGDALCWIIDPIDGTHNFAHGETPFGIMIALAERGETMAGWIYDPVALRLCEAWAGDGARIDGSPVQAISTNAEKPVAAVSTIFMDAAAKAGVTNSLTPHCQLVDIPRCAAEQYPRLALGINDISIFERALPWDHAAGTLFLNEAGGKVAHWDGSPYRPGSARPGLLGTSTHQLWDQVQSWMSAASA